MSLMGTNGERVRNQITEEAAGWFVANRGGLDALERDNFAAWLKASPLHVEEYLAVSVITQDLRQACDYSQAAVDDLLERARLEDEAPVQRLWPRFAPSSIGAGPRSRQTAAAAMAACVVLSVALAAWWNFKPISRGMASDGAALQLATRHGEQQVYRLTDNSVLYLNSDSAVSIRYTPHERYVVLSAGEAYFAVAHEPDRPFTVATGGAEVRAVGTRFDVRLDGEATVVTVAEGRVAVQPGLTGGNLGQPTKYSSAFVELGADEQIRVAPGEWPPQSPTAVDPQRTTAWLHRNITFNHEPLERVTLEFNRYAPKPIEIATPGLRKLEITGNFATDDTAAFIAFLRSLDGVRVEETATQIRVSRD
jgi:transmembrane sensor